MTAPPQTVRDPYAELREMASDIEVEWSLEFRDVSALAALLAERDRLAEFHELFAPLDERGRLNMHQQMEWNAVRVALARARSIPPASAPTARPPETENGA